MTLPLTLTPFERHMLSEQRPGYPMSFFLQLRFAGSLDAGRLQGALGEALERHRMLRATVEGSGRRAAWRWGPADATLQVARDAAPWSPAAAIELGRQPGLRLTLREGGRVGDRLQAQFHHASCDAVGAMVFLEDLLIAYVRREPDAPPPALPPLDEAALRRRGELLRPPHSVARKIQRRLIGLARSWRFISGRPQPLGPCDGDWEASAPQVYPAACTRALDADETAALVDAAKAAGATVNDLLLRDWFLAADAWRRGRPSPHGGRLRLGVPINLRTHAHAGIPAANVVSLVFLDRGRRALADPARLLRSIHGELDRIKRLRIAGCFLAGMDFAQRLPSWMLHAMRGRRCWASAVLSNLGRVLETSPLARREPRLALPGAVLEGIDFLPPLRALTHAALGVLTYAGRLALALHYDARAIRPLQAEDLIETFVRRLRESIAAAAPPRRAPRVEAVPAA
jgi:hypothetical protein